MLFRYSKYLNSMNLSNRLEQFHAFVHSSIYCWHIILLEVNNESVWNAWNSGLTDERVYPLQKGRWRVSDGSAKCNWRIPLEKDLNKTYYISCECVSFCRKKWYVLSYVLCTLRGFVQLFVFWKTTQFVIDMTSFVSITDLSYTFFSWIGLTEDSLLTWKKLPIPLIEGVFHLFFCIQINVSARCFEPQSSYNCKLIFIVKQ